MGLRLYPGKLLVTQLLSCNYEWKSVAKIACERYVYQRLNSLGKRVWILPPRKLVAQLRRQ